LGSRKPKKDKSGSKPVLAIVGRPNVGKSTLFNRLVQGRKAITIDVPGATRDRNYGEGQWFDRSFVLIDTGGFEPAAVEGLLAQMREQTVLAMEEADIIIFLLDARSGLMAADKEIAALLRRLKKPVFYAVNKIDGDRQEEALPDFTVLGVDELYPLSAQHGRGLADLMDAVGEFLPPALAMAEETRGDDDNIIRVAFVGKPNAGKSSLVNRILGYERSIVNPLPGTTSDAIDTPLSWEGRNYLLIDTAGIRRKSRISLTLEKYSVIQAVKAAERADVVVLVIDAQEGLTEQDAKIAGLIHESGRAAVFVVNKWDLLTKDDRTLGRYVERLRDEMAFMSYAPIAFVSAKTGQRVVKIFAEINLAYDEYVKRVPTAIVNKAVQEIINRHPPPRLATGEQTIAYVTQAGVKPPTFVFFVREPGGIHFSYERFLINSLRDSLGFRHSPLKVIFRSKSRRRTPGAKS
jgi:GTP-binding protein